MRSETVFNEHIVDEGEDDEEDDNQKTPGCLWSKTNLFIAYFTNRLTSISDLKRDKKKIFKKLM